MRNPKSVVPSYIPGRPFVVDPPATELVSWLWNQTIERANKTRF